MSTTYRVACLSGPGTGPELMMEASRALSRVSRLHGFVVEETHPPIGGEAMTQFGHALPAGTRSATLAADAILVAAVGEPALAGLESELDLLAQVERVAFGRRRELTVFSPLDDEAGRWTIERAFALARSSRGRISLIGGDEHLRRTFDDVAQGSTCVLVTSLSVREAAQTLAFDPDRFDAIVTPAPLADGLAALAANGCAPRIAASGRLAASGPSIFAPAHRQTSELAGHGVANPAAILLATALLLEQGLGESSAARTLAGAVVEASSNGVLTPDVTVRSVGATTREFGDVVLHELPAALTNAEFYREAVV
jgi:3-isopropylmalate dehydrogenase